MQIDYSEHIYDGLGLYGGGSVSSVYGASFNFPRFFICKIYRTFEADPIRLLFNVHLIITYYVA